MAANDDTSDVLTARPGYLIERLHQIAEIHFLEEAGEFGVTSVQFGAMLVIDANPGVDQIRVANALHRDRTTISGVVDRLEAKRLIVRRPHREDRRAKALFMTPAGKRLLEKLRPAAARAQRRILESFGDEEKIVLVKLLERAVDSFERGRQAARTDRVLNDPIGLPRAVSTGRS
jgi:DNA-binding MarR family transcriptional regulator